MSDDCARSLVKRFRLKGMSEAAVELAFHNLVNHLPDPDWKPENFTKNLCDSLLENNAIPVHVTLQELKSAILAEATKCWHSNKDVEPWKTNT